MEAEDENEERNPRSRVNAYRGASFLRKDSTSPGERGEDSFLEDASWLLLILKRKDEHRREERLEDYSPPSEFLLAASSRRRRGTYGSDTGLLGASTGRAAAEDPGIFEDPPERAWRNSTLGF
ncbi:hypothetical protein KM043_004420 [Ampulex compressa]|nr:hypothetical protein KM043_004420 [Ampulex compressa]